MAEEKIQHKATEPTAKRGVTTDIALAYGVGTATGAGLATGKVIVDKIVGHVSKPQEAEPQQVILPPGVEKE